MKVGIVTGFIPLPVKHLSVGKYHDLWLRLADATEGLPVPHYIGGGELRACWAYALCTGLPPANPPPADRYDTPEINVMSHIVQHQRTTWALAAAAKYPDIDVWVWFDYGIMKQGDWTGKPIKTDTVQRFLARLASVPKFDHIPFPGIAEKAPVFPTGNNWRFCGSTHIWPKQFLPEIDRCYKAELRGWIAAHRTVPLDLPIWALVEQGHGLPFRWYPAEYDATQLDNFALTAWQDAGMLSENIMTPLCELARKHETDKGGQHFRYGGGDSDTNHNYTPEYHSFFAEDRDDVKHVLEIGVHMGSSLRMWKEYFPNAQIVGLDTNHDCLRHTEDRIKVIMADQNNPASLVAALGQLDPDAPKFDMIVDDGSHEREHQITSLKTLLPFLAPWGYYVIEDLGTGVQATLQSLVEAVPEGFDWEAIKIVGGLGPKVQPHEWLFVVRHR